MHLESDSEDDDDKGVQGLRKCFLLNENELLSESSEDSSVYRDLLERCKDYQF